MHMLLFKHKCKCFIYQNTKNSSFYKFLTKNALGKIELSQPRTLHQESVSCIAKWMKIDAV